MYVLLALALLMPAAAAAQGTGTLAGRVTYERGEGLPGASVKISGLPLGDTTDVDGYYRIDGVPAGTYTVVASFTGFETATQMGVSVESGDDRKLSMTLEYHPIGDFADLPVECHHPLMPRDPFASRVVSRSGFCGDSIRLTDMPIDR